MRRSQRGLSLVETLLSLFLLSEVVLMLFNLLPSSLACINRSDQTLRGDLIAQSVMDTQQCLPFQMMLLNYSVDLPNQVWQGQTFKPHLDIKPVPGRDTNMLRSLKVTVTWEEHGRNHQSVYEVWVANVNR